MGNELFASTELHPREIRLRSGNTVNVYLKEMSESQLRKRQNLIVDSNTTRGRGGAGQIRLDRQRQFDFEVSIADWDFVDENGEKLPINQDTFGKLAAYVSRQVSEHIDDLNASPEDFSPVKDEDGNEVEPGEQNPT